MRITTVRDTSSRTAVIPSEESDGRSAAECSSANCVEFQFPSKRGARHGEDELRFGCMRFSRSAEVRYCAQCSLQGALHLCNRGRGQTEDVVTRVILSTIGVEPIEQVSKTVHSAADFASSFSPGR